MSSLSSQPQVLTDEPKWSSASLSITLKHLKHDFRPEYTHQLVGDECWRGYRPLEAVLRLANADFQRSEKSEQHQPDATSAPSCASILHKSHKHHNTASSELEIKVIISPSCQQCRVDIVRSKCEKREQSNGGEEPPEAKRRKTNCGPSLNKPLSPIESASNLPMNDSEIIDALSKALPPITSHDENTSQVEDSFLSDPIGDVLEEYSIPTADKTTNHYVLTIADGRSSNVSAYHSEVQKLALFYIENADIVDVANDADGGYWKIMYIFQKHDGGDDGNGMKKFQYSLVGYFTLFHFIALFRKPNPGLILRVCQALILPPFQGQGHGRHLLQNVYKLAHTKREGDSTSHGDDHYDIVQVNVEDPAPAFVALRNKLDFEFVHQHHAEWNWPEKGSIIGSSNGLASNDDLQLFFSAMTEKEVSEISVKAKIIPKQIHIANELFKLKAIQAYIKQQDSMSRADKETIERLFRLMVKRRLNKEHRDELLEEPSKDDQKALLAKIFDRELLGYQRILSKIR